MKKIIFLTCLCLALMLVSCNDAIGTSKSNETVSDNIDEAMALEFLKDGRTFERADNHTEATVYTLGYYGNPLKYALLDIDGDSANEMVIEYDNTGDTEILDITDGVCTAYYSPYRGITDLKKDGTMGWSNSAFENGIRKITFSSEGIVEEIVMLRDTEKGIYKVDGKYVDEAEYDEAYRLQSEKEGVEWITINEEYIPDFLTEFKNKAEGTWTKDYDEYIKEFVSFVDGSMFTGTLSGHTNILGDVIYVRKIGVEEVYEIEVYRPSSYNEIDGYIEEMTSYYKISFYDNKLKLESTYEQNSFSAEYERYTVEQ